MAFNVTTQTGKLARVTGETCELARGVTALVAGVATITVPQFTTVVGAIAQVQGTTSYIVSVTSTSTNTFAVIAEATSGGGAANISLSVSWLAWGIPKM